MIISSFKADCIQIWGAAGRSEIQECNGSVNLDLISRDSRGVFYAKI